MKKQFFSILLLVSFTGTVMSNDKQISNLDNEIQRYRKILNRKGTSNATRSIFEKKLNKAEKERRDLVKNQQTELVAESTSVETPQTDGCWYDGAYSWVNSTKTALQKSYQEGTILKDSQSKFVDTVSSLPTQQQLVEIAKEHPKKTTGIVAVGLGISVWVAKRFLWDSVSETRTIDGKTFKRSEDTLKKSRFRRFIAGELELPKNLFKDTAAFLTNNIIVDKKQENGTFVTVKKSNSLRLVRVVLPGGKQQVKGDNLAKNEDVVELVKGLKLSDLKDASEETEGEYSYVYITKDHQVISFRTKMVSDSSISALTLVNKLLSLKEDKFLSKVNLFETVIDYIMEKESAYAKATKNASGKISLADAQKLHIISNRFFNRLASLDKAVLTEVPKEKVTTTPGFFGRVLNVFSFGNTEKPVVSDDDFSIKE